MPTLTHNEAALVARMLEIYMADEGGGDDLVLDDTSENRDIVIAAGADLKVCANQLFVREAMLAEYLRTRLLDSVE